MGLLKRSGKFTVLNERQAQNLNHLHSIDNFKVELLSILSIKTVDP